MQEIVTYILPALGKAVLHSFWQGAIVWAIVMLYSRLSKVSAEHLAMLSFVGLCTIFSAFVATFSYFLTGETTVSHIIITPFSGMWVNNILSTISIIYLLLLFVPAYKFAIAYRISYKIKTGNLQKTPWPLKLFALDAAANLGIKRKVKVFVSSVVCSPLTTGFLRPVILLPVAAVNNLSIEQVQAIILHELAHIKRNDFLLNIISQLIVTLLYFNPFVKALENIQEIEREKSADGWVTRFEYDKTLYASALFILAKMSRKLTPPLVMKATGNQQSLLQRIEWMMGKTSRPGAGLRIKLMASLSVFLFVILSLINLKKTQEAATITQISQKSTTLQDLRYATFNAAKTEKPITASRNNQKTIAKKQTTQKTEILADEEYTTEPVNVIFINNQSTVTPVLKPDEEVNLQNALTASKKVFTVITWKQIEDAIAETITSDQKEILRKKYELILNNADWQKLENEIRITYKNIDWEKANEKLETSVKMIKADSIYNHYSLVLQQLKNMKKEPEKKLIPAQMLNEKINATESLLKYLDSLKNGRKTIDL